MFGVGSDYVEYADAYRKAAAAAAEAAAGGETAANGAAAPGVRMNDQDGGQQGGNNSVPSGPGSNHSMPSKPAGFPAFNDFPRDPDGQSSYILLPDAGAAGWLGKWEGMQAGMGPMDVCGMRPNSCAAPQYDLQ